MYCDMHPLPAAYYICGQLPLIISVKIYREFRFVRNSRYSFLNDQNALGRLHLLTAAVMRSAVVTATPQISAAN